LKRHPAPGDAADANDARFEEYVDVFIPKQLQNRLRHVTVFIRGDLRTAFDHRYAASQSAESLAQLQADVASAKDDHVVWTPLQVQRFDMGHRPGFSQTRRVGYRCVSAGVHENAVSGDRPFASIAQCDMNRTRCDERAVTEDEFIPSMRVERRPVL